MFDHAFERIIVNPKEEKALKRLEKNCKIAEEKLKKLNKSSHFEPAAQERLSESIKALNRVLHNPLNQPIKDCLELLLEPARVFHEIRNITAKFRELSSVNPKNQETIKEISKLWNILKHYSESCHTNIRLRVQLANDLLYLHTFLSPRSDKTYLLQQKIDRFSEKLVGVEKELEGCDTKEIKLKEYRETQEKDKLTAQKYQKELDAISKQLNEMIKQFITLHSEDIFDQEKLELEDDNKPILKTASRLKKTPIGQGISHTDSSDTISETDLSELDEVSLSESESLPNKTSKNRLPTPPLKDKLNALTGNSRLQQSSIPALKEKAKNLHTDLRYSIDQAETRKYKVREERLGSLVQDKYAIQGIKAQYQAKKTAAMEKNKEWIKTKNRLQLAYEELLRSFENREKHSLSDKNREQNSSLEERKAPKKLLEDAASWLGDIEKYIANHNTWLSVKKEALGKAHTDKELNEMEDKDRSLLLAKREQLDKTYTDEELEAMLPQERSAHRQQCRAELEFVSASSYPRELGRERSAINSFAAHETVIEENLELVRKALTDVRVMNLKEEVEDFTQALSTDLNERSKTLTELLKTEETNHNWQGIFVDILQSIGNWAVGLFYEFINDFKAYEAIKNKTENEKAVVDALKQSLPQDLDLNNFDARPSYELLFVKYSAYTEGVAHRLKAEINSQNQHEIMAQIEALKQKHANAQKAQKALFDLDNVDEFEFDKMSEQEVSTQNDLAIEIAPLGFLGESRIELAEIRYMADIMNVDVSYVDFTAESLDVWMEVLKCLENTKIPAFLRAVNASGDTLLHVAIRAQRLDYVQMLLGKGSPVDIENKAGKNAFDVAQNQWHIEAFSCDKKATQPPSFWSSCDAHPCKQIYKLVATRAVEFEKNHSIDMHS
jgi:hypothetical protein